jgi:NAD(P)-dependent dehydrogenase (short-subunit alcohol dehydrogenase family)
MKTVLITGCSSGIGKSLVGAFLEQGWKVIATLRNADTRQDLLQKESETYGDQLIIQALDITQQTEIHAIADALAGEPLDCLINNAGYALFGALESCDEAQLRHQLDVNLMGPILLTRALLPSLRSAGGCVINLSSIMGFVGFPLSSAYCGSKAGLAMWSEALSHELAPHNVRVAVVEPGGFRTNFGSNIQWGAQPAVAYQSWTEGYHALQKKLAGGKGRSPQPVIKRILTLASASSVPLRSPVGSDSIMARWLIGLLPVGVRMAMFRRMFKRLFGGQHG